VMSTCEMRTCFQVLESCTCQQGPLPVGGRRPQASTGRGSAGRAMSVRLTGGRHGGRVIATHAPAACDRPPARSGRRSST
jgi:hypothetical protein